MKPCTGRPDRQGLRPLKAAPLKLLFAFAISQALICTLAAESVAPSGDEILAKLESENNRRHFLLKAYSGSRQYTLQNLRFGKQAAVAVLMSYRHGEAERHTVLARSGSDKLNGIIDKVLAFEAGASLPAEYDRNQITSANYRVCLLGIEVVAGFLAARARAVRHVQFPAWPDRIDQFFFRITSWIGNQRRYSDESAASSEVSNRGQTGRRITGIFRSTLRCSGAFSWRTDWF